MGSGVPLAHSSVEFNPCLVLATSERSGVRRLSPVLSARGRLGLAHYPRIFWAWRDWTAVGPDRDEEVYFLLIGLFIQPCFVLAVLGLSLPPIQLEGARG